MLKTYKACDLVEFPYPSGVGMHVGHIKAYSGLEVIGRKRRMQGYNVLFPIGFDAFGLPTENSAIKTLYDISHEGMITFLWPPTFIPISASARPAGRAPSMVVWNLGP